MNLSIDSARVLSFVLTGAGPGSHRFCFWSVLMDEHNVAFVFGASEDCQDVIDGLSPEDYIPGHGFDTLGEAWDAANASAHGLQKLFGGVDSTRVMSAASYRALVDSVTRRRA